MEHERKHVVKIPDYLIKQIKKSDQTVSPAAPAKRKRLKQQYRNRLIIRSVLLLLVLISVTGTAAWALTYNNAVEVYVYDELIGLIRMEKQISVESLTLEIQDQLEKTNQSKVIINPVISLNYVHSGKSGIISKDEMLGKLSVIVPFQVQASAFMLNGEPLAILKDKTEALTVQDNIFAKYKSKDNTVDSVSFVENVSIEDIFMEKLAIITMDKAIETLTAESAYSSVYIVKQGDVLGQIALKNNMTLSDLLAINPGITAKSTLAVGQELNVETVKPLLSVITVETVVKDEPAQAPIQQQVNSRTTATRVLQAGKDGKQRVTERVTRINGVIQETTVLNTVILEEPTPEIVEIPPQ